MYTYFSWTTKFSGVYNLNIYPRQIPFWASPYSNWLQKWSSASATHRTDAFQDTHVFEKHKFEIVGRAHTPRPLFSQTKLCAPCRRGNKSDKIDWMAAGVWICYKITSFHALLHIYTVLIGLQIRMLTTTYQSNLTLLSNQWSPTLAENSDTKSYKKSGKPCTWGARLM